MVALALVKEGRSRTEEAQSCGMDRQTLRDWVHRYNEAGLGGLSNKLGRTGPKRLLSPEQEAEIATLVRAGPQRAGPGEGRRGTLAADGTGARDQGPLRRGPG
jgi:transposase